MHLILTYLLYTFLSKGLMLFFVSNLYWFQLNRKMGPIATNMNKVFNDILMVFYAYAVFFLASAAAFHLILNRIVFGNFENCDNDEVRQELQNTLNILQYFFPGI